MIKHDSIYRSLYTIVAQSKNCMFGVNTMIELKIMKWILRTVPASSGLFWLRIVPVLSDLIVMFLSSIVVLTPSSNFWVVLLLQSVSDMLLQAYHNNKCYCKIRSTDNTVASTNTSATSAAFSEIHELHKSLVIRRTRPFFEYKNIAWKPDISQTTVEIFCELAYLIRVAD